MNFREKHLYEHELQLSDEKFLANIFKKKNIPEICTFGRKCLFLLWLDNSSSRSCNLFFSKVHPACHNIANGIKPGNSSKKTDKHAADFSKLYVGA